MLNIDTVEELSKGFQKAYDAGILNIFENKIQLSDTLFEQLFEKCNFPRTVTYREDMEYPIEVYFIHNDKKYFTIYSVEEFVEGVDLNERVTSAISKSAV